MCALSSKHLLITPQKANRRCQMPCNESKIIYMSTERERGEEKKKTPTTSINQHNERYTIENVYVTTIQHFTYYRVHHLFNSIT